MQRVRAYEPDGKVHPVECVCAMQCTLQGSALLDNARFLPPRPPTADEKILRLAQALYVAETAADEQQTAAGVAAGGDAAEPHAAAVPEPAATLAKAADFVLKARTELEVRSTRRVFRVVQSDNSLLFQPLLDVLSYFEDGTAVNIVEVQRRPCVFWGPTARDLEDLQCCFNSLFCCACPPV
jgi:hypothetical protein